MSDLAARAAAMWTWDTLVRDALRLPRAELVERARGAIEARHRCVECRYCAAVYALGEMEAQAATAAQAKVVALAGR